MNRFSVILPVRNGGEYVKLCVESILSQTEQNFNLIILDNCSTDGTLEWLTSLKNERIIIYPSAEPLTIEENWGRIVTVPKNEFITLIGHDDILYPDFLKNIHDLMNDFPAAGLYHTHFNFIDAEGTLKRTSKKMKSFYTFHDLLEAFLTQSADSMGTGYVMRSADYDAIGGIPVRYPSLLFADFELWLNLARRGGMAVHASTSFAFRVHNSTTGSSADSKLHNALGIYTQYLSGLAASDSLSASTINQYGTTFLLFYCKGFAHRLLRTPLAKRNGLTVKRFIDGTTELASLLGVKEQYRPEHTFPIKVAKLIDSSSLLRTLFLIFKKVFPGPVL